MRKNEKAIAITASNKNQLLYIVPDCRKFDGFLINNFNETDYITPNTEMDDKNCMMTIERNGIRFPLKYLSETDESKCKITLFAGDRVWSPFNNENGGIFGVEFDQYTDDI